MSLTLARPALKRAIMAGETPQWVLDDIRSNYLIAVALSLPPWVDRTELKAIQTEARRMTALTGVLHVVDHVVPITHTHVCGLTVPWNLRVVSWRVNAAKGNKFSPDQMELFE